MHDGNAGTVGSVMGLIAVIAVPRDPSVQNCTMMGCCMQAGCESSPFVPVLAWCVWQGVGLVGKVPV